MRAPGLTPRGFQRLILKYDELLSNVAFNFNQRPYIEVAVSELIKENMYHVKR